MRQGTGNYKQETINGKQRYQASGFKLISFPLEKKVSSFKLRLGFTLIELLIVISIFGLTASLITASYLTFERNQRLKTTAQKIKTDLRFVQNEALSGNKGVGSIPSSCLDVTPTTLVGYYMKLSSADSENTTYTVAGDCQPSGGSDSFFNSKSIALPTGVKINKIIYSPVVGDPSAVDRVSVNILFQPLAHNVTFFETGFTPPFLKEGQLDASKVFGHALPQNSNEKLTIELIRENTKYQIVVLPSGEVNEIKP